MSRVRVRAGGSGFPAALGWLLLVLGMLFVLAALNWQARLALWGETTLAEVVANPPGTRRNSVTIQFTTLDGHEMKMTRQRNLGAEFAEGQQVPVRYLAGQPDTAEIASLRQLWFPLLGELTLGALCLAGGSAIIRARRRSAGLPAG